MFLRQILKLNRLNQAGKCINIVTTRNLVNHSVIVSTSLNIYHNLALEDWLFENTNLKQESVLLMWRDSPCVVIGRHQNPWVECNVPYCELFSVKVARRKSGGGAVYHDDGNVNVSFITDRSLYNRRANLQSVVDALADKWAIPLSINDREDILIYNKNKVSGTASKLSRDKSYHHFTLLCKADRIRMSSILHSNMEGVSSKATKSTPAPVGNLSDHQPNVDFDSVVHVISEAYIKDRQNLNITNVNPLDEIMFPGVTKHAEELMTWGWIYGKTPHFTIQRTFTYTASDSDESVLNVSLTVGKGRICNVELTTVHCPEIDAQYFLQLKGCIEGIVFEKDSVLKVLSDVKTKWIEGRVYEFNTSDYLDWVLWCLIESTGLYSQAGSTDSVKDVPI
ncbi:lipoyltransferase 1, mitochondrial-like isoform X1 [Mya arenaria]|uniref:lipoyltransferase 1, mitochondrial-like isoform X1 n=2 Tax=Mya arenaria TaxID=6604 RepID=UPI0022E3C1F6|nr:lipoyltransferase 1, mitochondrial-like isoform X1 [Mya arenaria]